MSVNVSSRAIQSLQNIFFSTFKFCLSLIYRTRGMSENSNCTIIQNTYLSYTYPISYSRLPIIWLLRDRLEKTLWGVSVKWVCLISSVEKAKKCILQSNKFVKIYLIFYKTINTVLTSYTFWNDRIPNFIFQFYLQDLRRNELLMASTKWLETLKNCFLSFDPRGFIKKVGCFLYLVCYI